jgi:hypothetical protein
LVGERASYDIIYVDGSHLFEDVFVDFYYATRLLAQGGVMAFDDSSDPHVRKVVRFVSRNFHFAYRPLDLGPYRADRASGLRYRAAKALGRVQLTAFQKIGPATRAWNSPYRDF